MGVWSDSQIDEFKTNNLLDLDDQLLQYVYSEVRGPKFTRDIDKISNYVLELQKELQKELQLTKKYADDVDRLTKFIQKLSKLRKEDRQKFEDFDQKYHFDVNQCNILINLLQESNRDQASSNNDLLHELFRIINSKVLKLLRKIDSIKK